MTTRIYNLKNERLTHIPKLPASHFIVKQLPDIVDNSHKLPNVFDQGDLGSCTANALVSAYYADDPSLIGSRLFLYYNERSLDKNPTMDNGSTISQGINALTKFGLCSEASWEYDPAKFADKPSPNCYTEAKNHEVITSSHLTQNEIAIKNCLVAGNVIALGIIVYESFERIDQTGMVPMPMENELVLGGHAVILYGYDNNKKVWCCRNSWGETWGDKGNFYLPFNYLLTDKHLSSDFWIINKVSNKKTFPSPVPFLINKFQTRLK
jgi:C1A family cysteine protease